MGQEEIVRPDRWCIIQIFDAIEYAKAAVARIEDRWAPTNVQLEVSRSHISIKSNALGYTVTLAVGSVSVFTNSCSLIIHPDEVHLYNHAANVKYHGKYLYVDQHYYYTGKELYSAYELFTEIKQIFEKAVAIASEVVRQ